MRLAPQISDALRRGASVVAANARAARVLHLDYAAAQRAAGPSVWPTPAITDWSSWLRDLWQAHAFSVPGAPLLLTPLQERVLWTRCLGESFASFAPLAADAWSLLSQYQAHDQRRNPWGLAEEASDAELFRQWAAAFERECSRHRWLSPSQLETALAPHLAGLTLPPEILLVGFDRFTPAQRSLLAALESRSIAVAELQTNPLPEAHRSWVAAPDQRGEWAACAAWARRLLLENPDTRIGVLVSSLRALRNPLDRTLRGILLPACDDIRRPSVAPPWEFSLGEPLAELPAIHAALLLLRWIARPLPQEEISWLLLSGFVSDTVAHSDALARHDARRRGDCVLSPERTLPQYQRSLAEISGLRGLYARLGELERSVTANRIRDNSRLPSAWTVLIPFLLERAGWPGPRTPDSVQFQALERWQRLLDELALLDFDNARYSYTDFLSLLERHARETVFSPESRDAPIQILGPFESSGQHFDALWFMGADDTRWPQRGSPHPLLPRLLQRKFAMPHATPTDAWNLAQTVTTRLLAAAPHIVFSFAERDAETEYRPSPLIANLFPPGTRPERASPAAGEYHPTPRFHEISDDSGALPWPREQNAGGASILRSQAACPFQAFAARRLAAEPLDAIEWGLDPAEKGKLLHNILERLFSPAGPLRTQQDLVTAIAENTLPAILDSHIHAAVLALLHAEPDDPWQRAWIAIEKRRLHDRLFAWLTLESQRMPFTVEACEQKLPDVQIGGLRLNLRADRIDLLPDGSRLILDYKSGDVSARSWDGDRPGEPQLPLYAAYGHVENLSGVLLAKIRAGDIGFDGRLRDARAQLLPGLSPKKPIVSQPYTEALRDEWAVALENLAAEFLRGEAAVEPRDRNECRLCGRQSLCRIAEHEPIAPDDEVPDEDADV